jgi:cobalt-zinc-cadmium efflux system outer membrane protein
MRLPRQLSLAGLAGLAATATFALPTEAIELTRSEVVDRALANSYEIVSAERRRDVTQARIADSKPLLASNPYLSFSYWDSTDQTLLGDGRTDEVGPSYTLSLSQTFEIAGQRGKRIQIANHNDAVAAANIEGVRRNQIAMVERAFNETLEAHERATLAYETLHWQRQLHKAYRNSTETQRNDSLIRISRAESEHASEKHSLFLLESRLRRMLDVPEGEPLVLVGDFPDEIVSLPPAEMLISFALAQRADLAAHRAAAASDDAFVSLARRNAVPSLTVSGFLSHSQEDDFGDEFQFGGSVSLPLPVFRTAGPTIDEAVAERARAHAELADVERTVAAAVREAHYACVVAANDVERVRRDVLPLARRNVGLQDAAFDAGKAGIWELVNAETSLIGARREELSALRIYANALVDLERVLGASLNEVPLGDAVATGDPEDTDAASMADGEKAEE